MKETQEILKKIESLQPNEKAILATVVDVQGSSYRLPGAKMLILENGETFGTVSGGCLEADVLERAKKVLETGEPQVFVYDTTNDQDSVFSLNMGCRGVIRILLEPIDKKSFLARSWGICFQNDDDQATATLISCSSEFDVQLGGRMYYDKIEQFHFQSFPTFLEKNSHLINDCEQFYIWKGKKEQIKTYKTEQGEFEFFFDYLALPTTELTIFGAGADVIPVTEFAKNLGWRVNIVDHREKIATKERFPNADKIIISRPEEVGESLRFDDNSVAVLMTHNYEHDKEILKFLLKSEAKYIGALGPKRRAENILKEFEEEGLEFTERELAKFYSPIGLDIGADTPEAIALAVVAEVQAVLKEREGGFLRNRKGSIYGRS